MKRPAMLPFRPRALSASSRSLLLCASVTVFTAACTVGPNFVAPKVAGPKEWGALSPSTNAAHRANDDAAAVVPSRTYGGAIDTQWWLNFGDPELNSLIARLATQNLDVQAAAQRVDQAMSERKIVGSAGLPKLDGQASYQRQRVSPGGTSSLEVPSPGAPLEYNLYQDGLSASWELDLFGKVRRGVEAADANLQSTVAARRGIALTVLSELVRDYMQLRGVQQDEGVVKRNIALADKNIALVQAQFENGTATTLDVSQARGQRAAIAATLPTMDALQAQLINAIGALLAMPPQALSTELRESVGAPLIPPRIPVGLPGSLARQRPDIQEAEARLHQATAQTGVAVASFYPDVTLTGNFNLNGLLFANAFKFPDRAFGVGPSIDIPLFQGGRLKGTLHLRQAQQREAAIQFRQTVLRGWQEVDDAMTTYRDIQQARNDLMDVDRQNQTTLAIAKQRYTEGVVNFLSVTSAQQAVLQSERGLVDNETQLANALVTLYVALGGGWQLLTDAAADTASVGTK